MELRDILVGVLILFFVGGFGVLIVLTIWDTMENEIFECTEYEDVKFKYVTSGGLFGQIRQMETISEDYDGWKEKCVKGNNFLGEEIRK